MPASRRSGIRRKTLPCRRDTPWTATVAGPVQAMRAPMPRRKSTRSSTSGSVLAFSITVSPSAMAAAMMMFSVPVWLG